jgi:hypothetical protein
LGLNIREGLTGYALKGVWGVRANHLF